MRWKDYLRLGWDQLKRRIVVTALCAIGIAIGSASIIVALSFGESVTHYSQQQMSYYMKTDEITIYGQMQNEAVSVSVNQEQNNLITPQKLNIIKSLPHVVSAASYNELGYVQFNVDETKSGQTNIIATELNTLDDFGYEFQQGAESELENTVIISYSTTLDLYDERTARIRSMQMQQNSGQERNMQSPLISYPLYQKQIILKKDVRTSSGTMKTLEFPVRVAGVLKKPDGQPDYMLRSQREAYVSPQLGKKIQDAVENAGQDINGFGGSLRVKVKVDDTQYVEQVEKLIQKLKLNTQSNLFQQERMNGEFVIIRLVFGGIGLFVLFVASISIVVAMTMSTYQRRRQIGIMKVLGANLRQIRNMFIIESTLLGLLGGLCGILLSYWVIWAINIVVMRFANQGEGTQILFISLWILPVGLFFALLTGVLSGIYPAIKASRTDALTAIKRD